MNPASVMFQSQQQPKTSIKPAKKLLGSDLLKEEESPQNAGIPTFCKGLDNLIENGIKPGTITEVIGEKGVGKTTFCLQLCLNVQIPLIMEGHGSEAVFINTESSFSPGRLMEMAVEFVSHCNKLISRSPNNPNHLLTEDQVMSSIHLLNCYDVEDLTRAIMGLENYLKLNSKVKLVVIDSIAFPMYSEDETFYKRTRVLYGWGQILYRCINQYGVAIVLTNNMTTRFDEEDNEFSIPFLGESWSHVPNQRILFSMTNKTRTAELIKSSFCPKGSACYTITTRGFRDP